MRKEHLLNNIGKSTGYFWFVWPSPESAFEVFSEILFFRMIFLFMRPNVHSGLKHVVKFLGITNVSKGLIGYKQKSIKKRVKPKK